jgi:uncharacterized protein with PIN domain
MALSIRNKRAEAAAREVARIAGGSLDRRLGEPESRAIAAAPRRHLCAFTALETTVVVEARKGEAAGREFDLPAQNAGFDIVPLDAGQVDRRGT